MTERLDYKKVAGEGMKPLLGLHTYLRHCGLPADLLELVYLRVSLINGCAYCIDMHTNELLKMQAKPVKLTMLAAWREAEAMYSEKERAALSWAETVTMVSETHVPDSEYKTARSQFSEKELVDLTLAVGTINAFNRLAISFRATPASLAVHAR